MRINLFIVLSALVIFSSCKDEYTNEQNYNSRIPIVESNSVDSVQIINGILVFRSTEVAFRYAEKLNNQSKNDSLNKWEEFVGLLSQRRIYDQVICAENKLAKEYESYSDQKRSSASIKNIHSKEYYNALKSGVIEEEELSDGQTTFRYSIKKSNLAGILNIDGIFAIGDTIYQFTNTEEKVWYNGDIKDISPILNAKVSDHKKRIEVSNSISELKSTSSSTYKSSGWIEYKSNWKIIAEMSSDSYQYLGNGTQWLSTSKVRWRSLKKSWYGAWNYDWSSFDYYITRQGLIRYMPDYPNSMWITQYLGSTFREPDSGYSHTSAKSNTYLLFSLFSNDTGGSFYTSFTSNGKDCVLDEVKMLDFFLEMRLDNGCIITMGLDKVTKNGVTL